MLQQCIQGWKAVVDRPTLLCKKPAACTINRDRWASSVVKQNNKSLYQCYIIIKAQWKPCKHTVISGNASNTFQADFFPWPLKLETVSHPIKPYQKSNAKHFCLPMCWPHTWVGKHLYFLPASNSNHSSSISRSKKWEKAIATISVSTVLIRAHFIPLFSCMTRVNEYSSFCFFVVAGKQKG